MNINELLRPPPARAQHNEDVHAQPSVVDPRLLPQFEQSYSGSQTPPNQPSSYYSSPYPSLEMIPVDLQEASKEKGAKRKRNAEESAIWKGQFRILLQTACRIFVRGHALTNSREKRRGDKVWTCRCNIRLPVGLVPRGCLIR